MSILMHLGCPERLASTMVRGLAPTWTKARTTIPQTLDPNMILDAIHKTFKV